MKNLILILTLVIFVSCKEKTSQPAEGVMIKTLQLVRVTDKSLTPLNSQQVGGGDGVEAGFIGLYCKIYYTDSLGQEHSFLVPESDFNKVVVGDTMCIVGDYRP
jgi:hypothetical protein